MRGFPEFGHEGPAVHLPEGYAGLRKMMVEIKGALTPSLCATNAPPGLGVGARRSLFPTFPPPTLMHRCLTILEVVCLVCEELATDRNPIAGYSALVRLAETCRLMYEPSMNSLWYGLDNIVPLLRCFPEDVWEASDPEGHFREFVRSYSTSSSRRLIELTSV